MARPRIPSNVMELRGSFETHPSRARKDAEGVGQFSIEPPAHLPQECVRAWRDIASRLPLVAIYQTDELAVEIAAKALTVWRLTGEAEAEKSLRHWFAKLGMSPVDRTRLAPVAGERKNKFTDSE